jgi:hypothetical protein
MQCTPIALSPVNCLSMISWFLRFALSEVCGVIAGSVDSYDLNLHFKQCQVNHGNVDHVQSGYRRIIAVCWMPAC